MWSSDNLEMIDEPKFPEYKFSFLTIWPGQLGFNKDNKVILLLNELFNSEILSLSNSDGLDWSKDMSWSQSGAMETPQHGNVSTRKCLKKSGNPSKTVFFLRHFRNFWKENGEISQYFWGITQYFWGVSAKFLRRFRIFKNLI